MISIVLVISLVAATQIEGACDYCQKSNFVACHSETVFSLCVDDIATRDYITCPSGSVCTDDLLVCLPQAESVPSCTRQDIDPESGDNQCGVCNSQNQVFSCINETTIAFCFGESAPTRGTLAHCPQNTVCNLNNPSDFCTENSISTASCRQLDEQSTTENPISQTTDSQTQDSTSSHTEDFTTDPTTSSTVEFTTVSVPLTSQTEVETTEKSTAITDNPTTTIITTPSPDVVCQGKSGMVDDPYDSTCKFYYLCTTSGSFHLSCVQQQYFDVAQRLCTSNKPDYCV